MTWKGLNFKLSKLATKSFPPLVTSYTKLEVTSCRSSSKILLIYAFTMGNRLYPRHVIILIAKQDYVNIVVVALPPYPSYKRIMTARSLSSLNLTASKNTFVALGIWKKLANVSKPPICPGFDFGLALFLPRLNQIKKKEIHYFQWCIELKALSNHVRFHQCSNMG